jgi:hypothetical protein
MDAGYLLGGISVGRNDFPLFWLRDNLKNGVNHEGNSDVFSNRLANGRAPERKNCIVFLTMKAYFVGRELIAHPSVRLLYPDTRLPT